MRIALLSNVTVEVLAGMFGKEHDFWRAPGFGAWREMSLSVPKSLREFKPEAVFLLLDASHASYAAEDVESAVTALEAALPQATVVVPDLGDLADEAGDFYDERMWRLASMPWSLKGLRAIRHEIDRLLAVMKGNRRKVLALDFDNVLWKGAIGEDGAADIEPFADFQRRIAELQRRGVLLVGLSRNNAADVEPVWSDSRMALGKADFADLRIDWRDKAENLSAVARALNLGLDSFVFVDDDPVERARMAVRHPEVTVAAWPISARRIARLYFPRMRLTDEDRKRTSRYRAEAERREQASGLGFEEYLKRLKIEVDVHAVTPDEYERVAQLSQRSNQFNVCTNRYGVGDIARFAGDPSHLLLVAHVSDAFGDMGLVAFVHAVLEGTSSARIADFVMSCRAMNRRVEFTVYDRLANVLRKRGVSRLTATWRRTAKNEPVRALFEGFGFPVVRSSEEEKTYEKILG